MQLALNSRRLATPSLVALVVMIVSACSDAVGPSLSDASGGDVAYGRKKAPAPTPVPPSTGNPIAGITLYVSPTSKAKTTADAWRSTRPTDAAQLDKIAAQPQANWFGNWNADVRADVDRVVSIAKAANALPVLVAYNIPLRDCGSYSAGGANNPDAYRAWITAYAAGLAGRKTVVILEPDAIAGINCLSAADQTIRFDLLRFAVQTLSSAGASVYLDAGNHLWQTVGTIASRLKNAGIEYASGFALNVSNFFHNADETLYGNAISALVGGKHYVIDTSRNGLGATADSQWCNPEGRALGARPTTATGSTLVDAFLWIKVPGESDGNCNGNPSAGTWMPEYALGLAQRASY